MKIWILSTVFILFLSCKKETEINKSSQNNSVSAAENSKKDTLTTKHQIKEGIFNFATDLCDNKGYFDENKYTKEELEGAHKLYYDLSGILLEPPHVFRLETLQEVRKNQDKILEKLDKEFTEKKISLENLKVVNIPYWQNVKKQEHKALIQEYELEKTQIKAYSDPSVLLNSSISKKCDRFVKALNSNDSQLTEEWRKLREEMSKRNSDPKRIMDEFENHLNSPDKKDYAILDLVVFGWGNCANEDIIRPQHDEKMNKEFNALFMKIDSDCDEP
ncbi:hypothetical protein M2347_000917 [Chryseobacterium sp. H1D6B]|uniref:hypothetical protein n=1 Tax=Chryseobacterium sp. H1D6B TaxID=2940588 RepID=UPI0015CA00C4|nr:hypothetical protein [Chryseobacterium sp. H1D6B]MDH6251190.1 hypothetical protein [Chryseobacterium sp. H1D6B]